MPNDRKGSLVIDSLLGVVVKQEKEVNILSSTALQELATRLSDILRQTLKNDTLRGFFIGSNPRLIDHVTIHGQGSRQHTIDVMVPASG